MSGDCLVLKQETYSLFYMVIPINAHVILVFFATMEFIGIQIYRHYSSYSALNTLKSKADFVIHSNVNKKEGMICETFENPSLRENN